MTDAQEDHEGTVSTGGRTIINLRFADDIDGLAGKEEELERKKKHQSVDHNSLSPHPHPTKQSIRAVQFSGE